MRYICWGWVCVLTIVLLACSKERNAFGPVLKQADLLMGERPDSALFLLETEVDADRLPPDLYAEWCLLLTQAKDKNYVVHTSDSLIDIAVTFFEKKRQPARAALACFYRGRVMEDLGNSEEALLCFLKARDYVDDTADLHFRGLLFLYIGDLQRKQQDGKEALEAYRHAFDAFERDGDLINGGYVLRNIGRTYIALGQTDSAEVYLTDALERAERLADMSLRSDVENDMATLFEERQAYDRALDYAMASLRHLSSENDRSASFLSIGAIWYRAGQPDSARYYLQHGLGGANLYTEAGINHLLALIAREQGDFKQAADAFDAYVVCRDSIEARYDIPRMQTLELLYNKEKVIHERNRLLQEKQYMRYRTAFLAVIGCLSFVATYLFFMKRIREQELLLQQAGKIAADLRGEYSAHLRIIEGKELQIATLQEDMREKEQQLVVKETEHSLISADLERMNERVDLLKGDLQQLTKYTSGLIDRLLEGSRLKEDIERKTGENQALSPDLWMGIQQKIHEFDPLFRKKLRKSAPHLTLKEEQLCCLVKLNIPLEQIAILLQVNKRTVSKYKSEIVKQKFERRDGPLLDTLL